jgi:serine/threonine protein kinase
VEVGKGLVDLHAVNIVHRDLKPENIYITLSNHFKIGFFSAFSSFYLFLWMSGDLGVSKQKTETLAYLTSVAGTPFLLRRFSSLIFFVFLAATIPLLATDST